MTAIEDLIRRVEALEEKFSAHCSVFQGAAKTICDLMDRVKELERDEYEDPPVRQQDWRATRQPVSAKEYEFLTRMCDASEPKMRYDQATIDQIS